VAERLSKISPGYIRPYDAQALSLGIQKVFQSGGRSNGREQIIAQGLTIDRIANRLIQIYQNVQKENAIAGSSN